MFNRKKKRIIELENKITEFNEYNEKIETSFKKINISLDNTIKKLEKLENKIENIMNENKAQKEEIEDLKSDRYVLKKIPSGRPKNTIKTSISRPMSSNVSRFMKELHE